MKGSFHKSRVLQSASECDDDTEREEKKNSVWFSFVSQFASSLLAYLLQGAPSPAFLFLLKHFSTLLPKFIFPKVF